MTPLISGINSYGMQPPVHVSPELLIAQLQSALRNCILCSPVYGVLKRQLAEYLFQTGKSLEGIMHLMESLAGKYKYDHMMQEAEWNLTEGGWPKRIDNIDVVKVFNSVPCEYTCSEEFLSDLNSLPPEWTLVQISRQPQADSIAQALQSHDPDQIETRLQEARLVVLSPGDTPLQVLLDKPLGSNESNPMKTYFDLISDALCLLKKSAKVKNSREKATNLMKDVSRSLADSWLREYQCLLPGKLKCPRLSRSVSDAVAKIIELCTLTPQSQAFLCRLLSGSCWMSDSQIKSFIARHLSDGNSERIASFVLEFNKQHSVELSNAPRYPVILLLEEELDKLPMETTLPLRSSPVSRVHCFQFLVALVKLHANSDNAKKLPRLRNGYLHLPRIEHPKDTFVVLNPSSDVMSLETNFKTLLAQKFGHWKGITGRVPSASEWIEGVNHPLFIYAGHGNGTLYCNSGEIGRSRVRSVIMLFGCRSVERNHIGGRVPYTSIAQKYFIAGSPCIVGNLWNVSSTDCDRLASNLLNLSFPSPSPYPSQLHLPSITHQWWNVPYPRRQGTLPHNGNFHIDGSENSPLRHAVEEVQRLEVPLDSKSVRKGKFVRKAGEKSELHGKISAECASYDANSHSGDLALNVQWARGAANYFINAAALVVWGLPVWFDEEE